MPNLYVSKALRERHFDVYSQLLVTCQEHDIPFAFAGSPVNVWIRDYMPVYTNGVYTKFLYKTVGYSDYPQMEVSGTKLFTDKRSRLVIDGGNVVQNDRFVVLTSMVFDWNKQFTHQKIYDELSRRFQRQVIILPPEPYDTLGHTDGILQFFGTNKAFVNNYDDVAYRKKVCTILKEYGIEVVLFPYAYSKCPQLTLKQFRKKYPLGDDFNPGVGYYINYLTIDGVYFLPTFGFSEDAKVKDVIRECVPKAKIVQINCFDLAMTGGLLHCVTWEK